MISIVTIKKLFQQRRNYFSRACGTTRDKIWAIVYFCAFLGTILTDGRQIEIERRVVNGRSMARGEWPFLASLHYLKPFPFTEQSHMKHICGGTLIHPQWVLTAAHCMGLFANMGKTEDWEVVLGEHNQFALDKGEQRAKVEAFHVHPEFQPNKTSLLTNDVALVKLSRPADMSQYVSIMGLNDWRDLEENLACEIGGWGQMQSEPYGWGMYIPLKARVYIVDNDHCAEEYDSLEPNKNAKLRIVVDDSIICAGVKGNTGDRNNVLGSDACMGDSGSPMICRTGEEGEFLVTGIVSAGEGCGNSRFAGIYTRVSAFLDWIKKVIQDIQ